MKTIDKYILIKVIVVKINLYRRSNRNIAKKIKKEER